MSTLQNRREQSHPRSSESPYTKITSLSTRSSPSIPPPSQAYEPFVKSVLSRRLLRKIFSYSAAYTVISAGIWRTWCEGGGAWGFVSNLVFLRPSTLIYALCLWCGGVLPVLIMRKGYLRLPSMHASSPSNVLRNAFHSSPRLRIGSLMYLVSALAFTAFHIASSNAYKPHAQDELRFFVKSKKHPYYLNGRVIFILTSQSVHAFMFFLRNIMLDRFFALRTRATQKADTSDIAKAVTMFITVVVLSAFSSCIHLVLFAFGRSIQLPIMLKIPILSYMLRPFVAHFLRASWTPVLFMIHLPLVVKTFFLGLLTVSTWEFSETIFDISVSEPVYITSSTAEPFVTLISGITSTDSYFRYFAYSELRELASEQSPAAADRRIAFFADQKFNPTLWSQLSRTALLQFGNDYQFFFRRGQSPAPAPPPTVTAPSPASVKAPSTPLIRKPIFKTNTTSPVQTAIDSLASDGYMTQAADVGASHIPELFRSIESIAPPVNAGVAEIKKVEAEVKTWADTTRTNLTKLGRNYMHLGSLQTLDSLEKWWSRERTDKVVQRYLGNRETDVLIVDLLSNLTCASLTEDRYGVVQRDIPKILEAFLSFLTAIEEYKAEISSQDTLATSDEDISKLPPNELRDKEHIREEVMKAIEVLNFVEDNLKEGIIRIVVTFGKTLSAFKFPPRIAKKLQGYVDYS